jgi:hypothetical protein
VGNKIIFLDIDGVLNCQDAYHNDECKYVDFTLNGGEDFYQTFYSKSKMWLNKLIEETGAKIVISSTWRHSGIDFIEKVWEMEKMSGEIIGLTPHLKRNDGYTIPRGCEIDFYLKNTLNFYHINWDKNRQQEEMDKSGVENYIIIDDDSDMLYNQKNHFVNVLPSPRNTKGFSKEHYELGLEMLSKSVIELNY